MMSFYSKTYLDSMNAGEREQLFTRHAVLGFHPDTRDELLLKDTERFAGMYLLGVQGVGKSGLLENLIAHDAAVGNAVIVIDPHGDLTAHCLAELPAYRLNDTYVLDMEDEAYPFGVNVFATGTLTTDMAKAQAVERIMHIFEVLWEDVLSQQHLPRYVRAATITFLANPGATLVDMHTFLIDADARQRMLARVTDPSVLQFWKTQYDDVSEVEKTRRIQPLVNRLEALFMGRSLIRNIVGQRRTSINFRKAIENRELVFIKLPVKQVAQDARLVGTILLAQLYAAVFSFADIPEAQRPGLSLYVDEFQHFATPDFASLFTEGRKFGVRLTLAHQFRDQLPKYLQDSTMTARTKVCFRVTPSDSNEMAREFPNQGEFTPSNRATKELLTRTSDFPVSVREFVETYLRTLPKSGDVEIKGIGPSVFGYVNKGAEMPKITRPNPMSALDNLFYEVMMRNDPTLPIPENAVYGLANGGMGFYGAIGWWTSASILTNDVHDFPAHLVTISGGTPRWTRQPEGAKEQLLHCIFYLRLVMHYLAEHPIGKQAAGSGSVAGMLTQLPARAAFVKSDKAVGVIYTHNTPARLSGRPLQDRLAQIQARTRAKYCHPREAIERALSGEVAEIAPQSAKYGAMGEALRHETTSGTQPTEGEIRIRQRHTPAPVSRWEEVDG